MNETPEQKLARLKMAVAKREGEQLTPRTAKPAALDENAVGTVPATARDLAARGRFGWHDYGHFMQDVARAGRSHAHGDVVLGKIQKAMPSYYPDHILKAGTGLNEASGPDGGFLIPPTFANGILEIMHSQDSLLDMCDKYDMSTPSMKFRAVDETSRANGSRRGGLRGYWVDEGGTITASRPKFRQIDLTAHKVAAMYYATEELLADATMLQQATSRFAADELTFVTNDAVINGTGAGQPLGILNSACTVSVAKETGQAAATLQTENITKMWARLHRSSRASAVWLINQDVAPALYTLTLGIGTAGVTTYMPPGGLSGKPYATLMGLPVIETEFNPTLGTVGDIMLVDMKSFLAATRGTVQATSSMHVQFLTDEVAFKFTFRVAGSPWWASALTPFKGTNTQSPFVTLATRA
jgi:HK97 family phage major capsid protein